MTEQSGKPPAQNFDAETSAILREAASRSISLWVDGERLCYSCRNGSLPGDLREALQLRKSDLVIALRGPQFVRRRQSGCTVPLPPHQRDWWAVYSVNTVQANFSNVVIKLSINLECAYLQAAMKAVFSRHDLFRARFEMRDGEACLAFSDDVEIAVTVLDAPEEARAERQLLDAMVWTPLEQGRVFRSFLIRHSEQCYTIGFVLYHLLADGWSCVSLIQELLRSIRQPEAQIEQPSSEPLQYSDYLLSLRDWLHSSAVELRLGYWRDAMRLAPATRLPEDYDIGAAVVGPLPHIDFQIDAPLRFQMAKAAADANVTLLIVILAAKFLALYRSLRSTDLIITPVIASRDQLPLLGMIGTTANLLPMRIRLDTDTTFASFLSQVQETYAVSVRHQVPWRMLMHTITQAGASVISPMLNFVPFVGEYLPPELDAGEGHSIRVEAVAMETPPEVGIASWHSSHEMFLVDTGQDMRGAVKYLAVRYQAKTVKEFIDTFIDIIVRCTKAPGSRICEALR